MVPGFLLITTSLMAQADSSGEQSLDLVTDRPDQTESSVVVPPGYFRTSRFHLEFKLSHSIFKNAKSKTVRVLSVFYLKHGFDFLKTPFKRRLLGKKMYVLASFPLET